MMIISRRRRRRRRDSNSKADGQIKQNIRSSSIKWEEKFTRSCLFNHTAAVLLFQHSTRPPPPPTIVSLVGAAWFRVDARLQRRRSRAPFSRQLDGNFRPRRKFDSRRRRRRRLETRSMQRRRLMHIRQRCEPRAGGRLPMKRRANLSLTHSSVDSLLSSTTPTTAVVSQLARSSFVPSLAGCDRGRANERAAPEQTRAQTDIVASLYVLTGAAAAAAAAANNRSTRSQPVGRRRVDL